MGLLFKRVTERRKGCFLRALVSKVKPSNAMALSKSPSRVFFHDHIHTFQESINVFFLSVTCFKVLTASVFAGPVLKTLRAWEPED